MTGGGPGIGKAIAERYGALGASVVVNYSSSANAAKETVSNIERSGGASISIQADVSKVPDLEWMFQASIDHFGRLDIVVINAGLEMSGQRSLISRRRITIGFSPPIPRVLTLQCRKRRSL